MSRELEHGFAQAEKYVRQRMETGLSDNLSYHRAWHTFEDVMTAVERLSRTEPVTGDDLILLKTAVLFHDLGYIERYHDNEVVGAAMAAGFLPTVGYSPEQIERIRRIILATTADIRDGRIQQKAGDDVLEKMICDADLDNFGRPDFLWISSLIRKEMENYGVRLTDRAWFERQHSLLTHHTYYTASARLARDAGKRENLRKVEELLREL